jgi:AraC-like DNA-binding protein
VAAQAGAGRFWSGAAAETPGIDGIWRHLESTDEREHALGLAQRHFVPPDGCSDLILRFSRGRLMGAPEDALFGVRFQIGTGGAVLKQRECIEREAQRLFERVEPEDTALLLDRLVSFSSEHVQRYAQTQPEWLRDVLSLAQARFGSVTVEELARHGGVSERTLHRAFGAWVGAAPKPLLRTLRIREAVSRVPLTASLAELAAELGFADQAHLSREMTVLWGTTPARLRGVSDSFKTAAGQQP